MLKNENLFYYIGILAAIVVYIIGLPIDVMDVDAAQYASISREMIDTQSFLIVKNRYLDYLDKPPLLFWLSSGSFYLFGVHNWSYKLPSVLFALLAVYSVYKFARLYYSEKSALMSALVLSTTQAFFLTTNDIRTDTMLCGAVAFASWHLAAFLKNGKNIHWLAGFTGIGLALLAKGPIGLVVPILAFGPDIILKRQWAHIFRWQWLAGLLVVAVLLVPMCLGLYWQYGTDGLYFYFWKQSFGRVSGENQWRSNGGFFFLFHSFLWSFLPWSLLAVTAIAEKAIGFVKQKFNIGPSQEFITLAGTLLSYVAIAQSKYQLPHYIYVFFPYIAVMTGHYMAEVLPQRLQTWLGKTIAGFQLFVYVGLWVVAGVLSFWVFSGNVAVVVLFALFVLACAIVLLKNKFYNAVIYGGICTALGVNFFMNSHIYPSLSRYQSENEVGRKIVSLGGTEENTFTYKLETFFALDFYTRMIVKNIQDEAFIDQLPQGKTFFVYTGLEGYDELKKKGFRIKELVKNGHYHITILKPPFLNPATRENALEKRFLLEVQRP